VPPFQGLGLTFVSALHLNVLGALITLAPRALYGAYAGAYGLSALEDQQLGGVLMWVMGGFVSLALVARLVHDLLRDEVERPSAAPSLASM
jgi:cytochrome c oxidase assembly factor CtaG